MVDITIVAGAGARVTGEALPICENSHPDIGDIAMIFPSHILSGTAIQFVDESHATRNTIRHIIITVYMID